MKFFITGGTGFIGRHLIKELSYRGHYLICISRNINKTKSTENKRTKWHEGEINSQWEEELKSCDALIHLAAHGASHCSNDWEKCFNINVSKSLDLFLMAAKSGVNRIINIGSGFEYGQAGNRYNYIPNNAPLEPKFAYGASKAAFSSLSWGIGVSYEIEMCILRPFYVYGPGENKNRFWPQLIEAGKKGEDFKMTQGNQIRDFQYISDAIKEIIFWCIEGQLKKGMPKIVNMGSGNVLTLKQFAEKEWKRIGAKGKLLFSELDYRKSEMMRFVPYLEHEREKIN